MTPIEPLCEPRAGPNDFWSIHSWGPAFSTYCFDIIMILSWVSWKTSLSLSWLTAAFWNRNFEKEIWFGEIHDLRHRDRYFRHWCLVYYFSIPALDEIQIMFFDNRLEGFWKKTSGKFCDLNTARAILNKPKLVSNGHVIRIVFEISHNS